jgi:hypothetical protein
MKNVIKIKETVRKDVQKRIDVLSCQNLIKKESTWIKLGRLVGTEFNKDNIIECFDETSKKIFVNKSDNEGYDFIAYEDNSLTEYYINVNSDNIISSIY